MKTFKILSILTLCALFDNIHGMQSNQQYAKDIVKIKSNRLKLQNPLHSQQEPSEEMKAHLLRQYEQSVKEGDIFAEQLRLHQIAQQRDMLSIRTDNDSGLQRPIKNFFLVFNNQ